MSSAAINLELADQIAEFYADPLRFVIFAYPWGEPGPLQNFKGPDKWQADFLRDLGEEVRRRRFDGVRPVDPIRMGAASGHGIGKSAETAWIVDWIMSTRPSAQGTVTANTVTQLETKTWAAIRWWTKLCITSHWFRLTSEKMVRIGSESDWFCTAQTCAEENSEAFAGQHAASSTSFYIFDEASAVPDTIFEVAEGGMTDGEPMQFRFGNPTRNTGSFYRCMFGSEQHRWNHRSIDSRTCVLTNKALIQQWLDDYGEDSDFFRVRVRGLPPSASELQYIDSYRVKEAQKRSVEPLADEPLICGFDVSGGGSAWNVMRFRKGPDARSYPPIRIPGEFGRDRAVLIAKAAEVMRSGHGGQRVDAMFVDSAFGAPIVERLHTLGYENVFEINFGGRSPDIHQENMRAYMYAKTKDWLLTGAIPAGDSDELALQLTLPGYHLNKSNRLVLESKQSLQERGEKSPDDADALVLTFAQHVAPLTNYEPSAGYRSAPSEDSWMG